MSAQRLVDKKIFEKKKSEIIEQGKQILLKKIGNV